MDPQKMHRFPPSRYPFSDVMNVSDVPQFVTLTADDSINSQAVSLFKDYLLSIRLDDQCRRVRFTCFVSFDASDCDAIQFLVDKNVVEFGHHTLKHTRLPSKRDIQDAIESLLQCGVPRSSLGGFRAPYLQYNQSTLDFLYANQVPYDSTIIPRDDDTSHFGRENQWPFTLENGFVNSSVKCGNTGTCAAGKAYPGMWQIPLYRWYHANNTFLNDAMDYRTFDEDVQDNFERRYYGNRAPFGIYLHANWLEENGSALKKWIQKTLDTYADVYFVTNMDLLQWMENPVPKGEYRPQSCQVEEYQQSGAFQPAVPSFQPIPFALSSPSPSARANNDDPSIVSTSPKSIIQITETSPEEPTIAGLRSPTQLAISAQLVAAMALLIFILRRIRRQSTGAIPETLVSSSTRV
ncbi:hypothetical protein FisN_14Lh392 [Fistulifera solaris]|uniref:NodB homology domain-containing protein n=1 Tax=Fistulifera solaris TaxID=1519565 RepID=A0A1Z5JIC9_FISSO|nr:hypothetical protein FisN_14Lh392 [Fistulifera solaris]|eukprot:GAX13602.1 hypothetical protein FisN_14Lh392 [Fistulifera solaris]